MTRPTQDFTVGSSSDFPPGSCRIVEAGGKSIGIYNVDGSFYAVLNVCPHKLAPVCHGTIGGTFLPSKQGEWIYGHEGYILRCVAHSWEFDIRTGEPVLRPGPGRLATYPVHVVGDVVVVTLPASTRAAVDA